MEAQLKELKRQNQLIASRLTAEVASRHAAEDKLVEFLNKTVDEDEKAATAAGAVPAAAKSKKHERDPSIGDVVLPQAPAWDTELRALESEPEIAHLDEHS